jgi:pimeloyl-ACP methyl ester carboxylesterase
MSSQPAKARNAAMAAVAAMAVVLSVGPACRGEDRPENPPANGPGAADIAYPHRSVRRFELGDGPRSYWLFEPAEPKPERAAVVVFLHGWFAVNPAFYGAWIDHLVRSGHTVVFPRYQNDVGTLPREFLPNAMAAIRDALGVLETGVKHVRPDPTKFVLIGHSAGGNLAAQIAAVAPDPHSGVPQPRAIIALMPGEVVPCREPSLDRIPASTLLIVAVGEDDLLVGDLRGRQIFTQASTVPRARKRYMVFRSDRHGFPPIVAEHTAPTGANRRLDTGEGVFRTFQMSLGEVNAMDRAGFWRVTDATLETAFAGKTFDEAILDEARFTHLGYWTDGRKVTPPLISDNLSSIPRVTLPNGIRVIPWELPTTLGDSSKANPVTRVR